MPVPLVQQAVLQARRDGIDVVVSFGGGSCADLGKAVCFFIEQEAGMPGAATSIGPVVPHISIPTTYSGAELTPFFGMTDPATKQKQGAGGPTSAPVIADLRPRPHRLHPGAGARRDRHERPGPLRGGGLLAAPHPRGRGDRTGRGAARSTRRCPASWPSRDDAEARSVDARRRGARRVAACSTPGWACTTAWPSSSGGRTGIPHGLANAIILLRTRSPSTPRPCPTRWRGSARPSGGDAAAADRRPARAGSACPAACPRSASRRTTSRPSPACRRPTSNVARNPRPVSEADALAILRAAW